jgi:PKHD-type hydroxylase
VRYDPLYKASLIPPALIRAVENEVKAKESAPAETLDSDGITRRSARVTWIKHQGLLAPFFEIAKAINRETSWDFDVEALEPLQYTEYRVGDEYGWHCDQHRAPYPDGRVRKFSFSVFLNDDFEGGAFDLETLAPNVDVRYVTFEKMRPNTALFFQADLWHRVRPVSKGVRKSLVGWVVGKKFR